MFDSTLFHLSKKNSPQFFGKLLLFILGLTSLGIKTFLAVFYENVISRIYSIQKEDLMIITLVSLLAIMLSTIARIYYIKLGEMLIQRNISEIQYALLEASEARSFESFDNISEGEWQRTIREDIKNIASYWVKVVSPFMEGVTIFFISLGVCLFYSMKLSIIVLILSFFSIIAPKLIGKRLKLSSKAEIIDDQTNQGMLVALLKQTKLINIFDFSKGMVAKYNVVLEKYSHSRLIRRTNEGMLAGLNIGFAFTISTIWMLVGIYFVGIGEITIAVFASFLLISDNLNWPFFNLANLYNLLNQSVVSFESLTEIENNLSEDFGDRKESYKNSDGLLLSSVNYQYSLKHQPITFPQKICIKKNDKVAIIGESGSGKSTLLKLLIGLYKPTNGVVEIIEDNIAYSGEHMRKFFSYVPQVTSFFQASILENITFKNSLNVKEQKLLEASCKIACCLELINELPNQFETIIGGNRENQLSFGQLQRVALARALYANSDFIVLDEATSSLDPKNEKKIIDNLLETKRGIIFVTHKLNYLDRFDQVIDLGGISKEGLAIAVAE